MTTIHIYLRYNISTQKRVVKMVLDTLVLKDLLIEYGMDEINALHFLAKLEQLIDENKDNVTIRTSMDEFKLQLQIQKDLV